MVDPTVDTIPELEIDGQKVTIDEIRRWRDGVKNMEKDYTRKTQEIAETRRQLEQQMTSIAPYLQLQQYLAEHPEKAAKLAQIFEEETQTPTGIANPDVLGQTSFNQIPNVGNQLQKLQQEIQSLRSMMVTKTEEDEFEKEVGFQQNFVQGKLDNLSKSFGLEKDDEDLVLAKLMALPNLENLTQEQFGDTIEFIAKQVAENSKKRKDLIIKDFIEQKKKGTSSKTEGPGKSPGFKPQPKKLDLLKGEVRQEALRQLEQYEE